MTRLLPWVLHPSRTSWHLSLALEADGPEEKVAIVAKRYTDGLWVGRVFPVGTLLGVISEGYEEITDAVNWVELYLRQQGVVAP